MRAGFLSKRKIYLQERVSLEQIIEYLNQKHSPLSIILYGSYANGTNDAHSDFDALVISRQDTPLHDTSFFSDVQLDVFVYPTCYFASDERLEDCIPIFDGIILADTDGIGQKLQSRVLSYLKSRPHMSAEELKSNIDWCIKMLERSNRGDAESLFRWHWVLVDSLEIFCELAQVPYLGPKKTLHWMEKAYPCSFDLYQQALKNFCIESLQQWIWHICDLHKKI